MRRGRRDPGRRRGGERRHGVTAPGVTDADPSRAGSGSPRLPGALYCASISSIARAVEAAQAASPGPCAMATVADNPARSQGQGDEAAGSQPIAVAVGMTRRSRRLGSGLAARRGLNRFDCAHGSLQMNRPSPGRRHPRDHPIGAGRSSRRATLARRRRCRSAPLKRAETKVWA
jgi:hypothetical protein